VSVSARFYHDNRNYDEGVCALKHESKIRSRAKTGGRVGNLPPAHRTTTKRKRVFQKTLSLSLLDDEHDVNVG
jgi:hypothetical protein